VERNDQASETARSGGTEGMNGSESCPDVINAFAEEKLNDMGGRTPDDACERPQMVVVWQSLYLWDPIVLIRTAEGMDKMHRALSTRIKVL
jgi:hypothetical protein